MSNCKLPVKPNEILDRPKMEKHPIQVFEQCSRSFHASYRDRDKALQCGPQSPERKLALPAALNMKIGVSCM